MNTNEEKYYAILMNKTTVREDEYLYKPITLIEGIREIGEFGVIFTDEYDNTYMDINNADTMYCDNEFCVAYIISETELIKEYNCADVFICKQKYLDEVYSVDHFGIFYEDEDKIETFTVNLREMNDSQFKCFKTLNNKDLDKKLILTYIPLDEFERLMEFKTYDELHNGLEKIYKSNLESDDFYEELSDGDSSITLHVDKFKEILDIKDYETLYSTLKEIYDTIMQMNSDSSQNNKDNKNEDNEVTKSEEKLNVKELKQYLDSRIIGQEEAKKDAILTVFNNRMVNSKDRSSCLFVGPTGSGKTLIIETICEYLNIPFEIIDVTQLSMPGYKGSNIEDFLQRLVAKTKGDIKKAEKAIVVLDELDKKGTADNSDISGKGALNTLLPFLQGTTYNIEYGQGTLYFDTSKLTVFATGAFTDVAREKSEKGYSSSGMGFSGIDVAPKEDIKYEKLNIEDLAKYGNIPIELLGRFTVITQLSGHTKESLTSILLNSELSPLQKKSKKLAKLGIELQWTENYINLIVENALKLKTGARSLKNVIERSMKYVEYEVIEEIGKYTKIILTENSVIDNENVELVDNNNNIFNLKDIILSKAEETEKRMNLRMRGNL